MPGKSERTPPCEPPTATFKTRSTGAAVANRHRLDRSAKDPRAAAKKLRSAHERVLAGVPAYREALKDFLLADTAVVECEQASALLYAEFKIKPSTFKQPLTNSSQVKRARTGATERRTQLDLKLQPLERDAAERLSTALELLHVPQVAAKVPGADALPQRSQELLAAALAVKKSFSLLLDLRNSHTAGMILAQNLQGHEQDSDVINALLHYMRAMHRSIGELRNSLIKVDYPFKHGRGKLSIASYCSDVAPTADDLGGLLHAGDEFLDRLPTLYVRVMGQLAVMGEFVESAVGLPPLKQPVE